MAAATFENSGGRRRFLMACDVRAEAESRKAPAPAHPRFPAAPASTMLLLMPGADITPDVGQEHVEAPPPAQAQLSIAYAGRWLVFDNVQPHIAAQLVRAAAGRRDVPPVVVGLADMPVARKESLRRFMEKRRHRLAAQAPYSAPRQGKVKDAEDGCWLGLGIPGSYGR